MRRRLLLLLIAVLAGFVVILATLPWWLGGVAKSSARSRGLTFGSYERVGYSRFVLRDVEYRRANVRVTVSRVEADTPVLWLWRHWQKRSATIAAGEWRVDVERSTVPRDPTRARGWVPLRAQLQRIAAQLDRWLPRAQTGAGLVRWTGGEISLASARWADRALVADDLLFRGVKFDGNATFAADDLIRVIAQLEGGSARTRLESRGAKVSGDAAWWDQPLSVAASYGERGWLPGEASFQAKEWTLPGTRLKLGELYATVRGSAQIDWRTGRFAADVNAAGQPLPDKAAPPLELALRGNGDMEAFTIQTLNAALPGLSAKLSAPVTIERSGKIRESAAQFALQADLAKVPWFSATGAVSGEARLVSGVAAAPIVEFALDASGVSARDVTVSRAFARGRLDWPQLQIAEGGITGGEGEQLTLRGGWDFRAKEIKGASIEGELRRASLARWLPKQPEFESVALKAVAEGPIANLAHSGRAQVKNVKAGGFNPFAVSAEWRGRGAVVEQLDTVITVGTSKIVARGGVDASALTFTTLEFTQENSPRLHLAAPTSLRWRPQLQLASMRLEGAEGNLTAAITAGETGRIEISASQISSRWFNDFVTASGPPWTLNQLTGAGSWDRGPMVFSLTGGAGLDIGEGRTASVNVTARGDKDGVHIEALRALEGNATVINATGRLPITFTPGASSLAQIDPKGTLVLDASVAPNAAFWQKLAAASGVELQDPQVSAHLTGTWQRPEGKASLQAARIAIEPKRVARPLPALETLDIQISGDRGGVTLSKCSMAIEGQTVRAQGRLPVLDGRWDELFKEPLAVARRAADFRLEVPDADVAVFTRFLPAMLAPKGRFQADVQYKNGSMEGFVRLHDAATRPLGPLGVLQEINADIAMSDRKFLLRGVTAKSGGQPVTLSGTVELPESGAPRFDLALRGENLPFVRRTGLLLRGDLDLKLQTPTNGQPRLSGHVRLRDSLFLSDVRAYLPKGGVSAARRPPYFAVETPPVNAWTLAVDVHGEQFLRMRTPVFTGVASARFRLSGTLAEPRAIGEIEIDEGIIRMPFASFTMTQASVRLTEADPYEPAVYVRATGRRYGYDLTMEVDGTATQPNIVFTSSPALDSEQVMLMVMTGAAPRNDISNSPTQRVANIGLFLSQSLLSSIGNDAADADRLSVAAGEKISRQGRETYDIEYKLSDRWTIVGEYNEFDEKNAGIKYRLWGGRRAAETGGNEKK